MLRAIAIPIAPGGTRTVPTNAAGAPTMRAAAVLAINFPDKRNKTRGTVIQSNSGLS